MSRAAGEKVHFCRISSLVPCISFLEQSCVVSGFAKLSTGIGDMCRFWIIQSF